MVLWQQASAILGPRETATSGPFPLGQPFAFCPHISHATRGFLLQHRAVSQTPLVFIHIPVFPSAFSLHYKARKYQKAMLGFV